MSEKIRPFVKWAGGKGSLIPQLNNFYPYELKNGIIERYIEPFVGGGAVLIDILQKYDVQEAYAFDINIDLITNLKQVETEYLQLGQEERKNYFYNKRNEYNNYELRENEQNIQRAAEFIYLNRTCFNG